ncbi:phosphate acyltransferase [Blastomonas aquatica]|uniref:phosphate acyltransferase n=1 Tax=Blastomonas aquatica TaxID=1510276 RepID=UPI003607C66A
MSHIFIFEVPDYPRLLLVSDAAIIIAPDLAAKKDIVQNAIDCAIALGISQPRVAVLAAVETVHPAMSATIDAASLAKMAHRGQSSADWSMDHWRSTMRSLRQRWRPNTSCPRSQATPTC